MFSNLRRFWIRFEIRVWRPEIGLSLSNNFSLDNICKKTIWLENTLLTFRLQFGHFKAELFFNEVGKTIGTVRMYSRRLKSKRIENLSNRFIKNLDTIWIFKQSRLSAERCYKFFIEFRILIDILWYNRMVLLSFTVDQLDLWSLS